MFINFSGCLLFPYRTPETVEQLNSQVENRNTRDSSWLMEAAANILLLFVVKYETY